MEVAVQQEINKEEFRPFRKFDGYYKPNLEEVCFFDNQYVELRDKYKNKIFDKNTNTIYGQPIEIVNISKKIAGLSSEDVESVRALKIGYMYIPDTAGRINAWGWKGCSIEEMVNKLEDCIELQKQINPTTILYGYDPECGYCDSINVFRIFKNQDTLLKK